MSDTSPRSFTSDFKLFFLRGLVVLLPTVLTLWIVVKAYQFVSTTIAQPINTWVQVGVSKSTPVIQYLQDQFEPTELQIITEETRLSEQSARVPDRDVIRVQLREQNIATWWDEYAFGSMNLIGFFIAITGVYFAGRLLGGFVGRRIYRRIERAIVTLPVFKQVYPYIKQVVDFLFGQDKQIEFKRVVLVEYPSKGIWSIGLLTGSAMSSVAESAGNDTVTVFIPSSPTPFTGYTISVPRKDVKDLPISIDEALRFTISGGVLIPEGQTLPPGRISQPSTPSLTGLHPIHEPEKNPDMEKDTKESKTGPSKES